MKKLIAITSFILVSYLTYAQSNLIKNVTITVDTTLLKTKKLQNTLWYGAYSSTSTPNKGRLPIDITNWHYLTYTKSSGNIGKMYIDGVLLSTDTIANQAYNWYKVYIGATYYTSWYGFYNGLIDDIRISNKVRTSTEILNTYNSNTPNVVDANTIGLWNFNETSGSVINNSVNNTKGNLFGGSTFTTGKFGNAISFNGVNGYGDLNLGIPSSDITVEFWFKKNGTINNDFLMELYGMYNMNIGLAVDTIKTNTSKNITWSTGATGYSVTVDPKTTPTVWVSNGVNKDTINLNGTCLKSITVTDTLKIGRITGINTLPNNFGLVKVYPNPAKDVLNISVSNPNASYSIQITNQLGQVLYTNSLSNSSLQVNVNSIGSNGLYFIKVLDLSNNVLDTRKLVLE